MASWIRTGAGSRRVFRRSLGVTETVFYYDSHTNGTADTVSHTTVEVPKEHAALFGTKNVARAWRSLKSQYPLLAATIKRDNSTLHFVVAEDRLNGSVPNEVSFASISSAAEGEAVALATVHSERKLSDDLLCRITILARTDDPSLFHLVIHNAHSTSDGVANISVLKDFLRLVSSPSHETVPDLESRLSLAVASDSLVPSRKMSLAKQRWRGAAGQIVAKIQNAKRIGGHTLPRNFGPVATRMPARSAYLRLSFTPEDSLRFIQTCRKHGITFGNAFPVLAQAALARVLCRRYVRGDISPEEWEFRKKQPYHTAGPINLRPFLDKAWFENGGQSNVSAAIGFFFFTLPFIPLGGPNLVPGDRLPEFATLLSSKRFFMRCNIAKKCASRYLNHPLFFEVGMAHSSGRIEMLESVAAQWERNPEQYIEASEVERHNVPANKQTEYGPVVGHGGSSFGNSDGIFPRTYPIEVGTSVTPPNLIVRSSATYLHCRSGELYLGSSTAGQQLHFILFYDQNVFAPDTAQEWFQEVEGATHWYLGQEGERESRL